MWQNKQNNMYADRVEATERKCIKERLIGNTTEGYRTRKLTGKRQRQDDDDKWDHDLYYEDERRLSNPRDLRFKLQRRTDQKKGPISSVRDLREKLSGTMTPQPINVDPPKIKSQAVVPPKKIEPKPTLEVKKSAAIAKNKDGSNASVEKFLKNLGLDKYFINFQVEEVDMSALVHMTDEELKAIGIPMGPRKKIMMALEGGN